MLNSRDEKHFDLIWKQKTEEGPLSGEYIPGVNQRIDFCIRYIPAGERFLDIGCGTGILAAQVKERFSEVHGVDIAELPIRVAQENNVKAIQLNLNNAPLPYPTEFFDTVTILSTIQYFYDIGFVLSEVHRVLKKDGCLILTVPNMRTFWRLIRLALTGDFPTTSKGEAGLDGGALHYFCYKNLARLLRECNFELVYSGGVYCIPGFINKISDKGWFGVLKREFFSAEVVAVAQKKG